MQTVWWAGLPRPATGPTKFIQMNARGYYSLFFLPQLSRQPVGLVTFVVSGSCLHKGTTGQSFLFSNGQLPLLPETVPMGFLPSTSWNSLLPGRPLTCSYARVPRFFMLGHRVPAGVWLTVTFASCAYSLLFCKIKNACVACTINLQCHLTELCVFTQLLTPEISSWEGDKSSKCIFL